MINPAHGGLRSTAADMLESPPDNLTILTNNTVERLVIQGKKALGVESNREKCTHPPMCFGAVQRGYVESTDLDNV